MSDSKNSQRADFPLKMILHYRKEKVRSVKRAKYAESGPDIGEGSEAPNYRHFSLRITRIAITDRIVGHITR